METFTAAVIIDKLSDIRSELFTAIILTEGEQSPVLTAIDTALATLKERSQRVGDIAKDKATQVLTLAKSLRTSGRSLYVNGKSTNPRLNQLIMVFDDQATKHIRTGTANDDTALTQALKDVIEKIASVEKSALTKQPSAQRGR